MLMLTLLVVVVVVVVVMVVRHQCGKKAPVSPLRSCRFEATASLWVKLKLKLKREGVNCSVLAVVAAAAAAAAAAVEVMVAKDFAFVRGGLQRDDAVAVGGGVLPLARLRP